MSQNLGKRKRNENGSEPALKIPALPQPCVFCGCSSLTPTCPGCDGKRKHYADEQMPGITLEESKQKILISLGYASLISELDQQHKKLDSLCLSNTTDEETVNNFLAEMGELQTKAATMRQDVDSLDSTIQDPIQYKAYLNKLSTRYCEREAELSPTDKKFENLQKQYNATKDSFAEAKDIWFKKITEEKEKNELLERKLDQLGTELEQTKLKLKRNQFNQDKPKKRGKNDVSPQTYAETQEDRARLIEQNISLKQEKKTLEQSTATLKVENRKLKKFLASQESNTSQTDSNTKELKNSNDLQLNLLQEQLNICKNDKNTLQQGYDKLLEQLNAEKQKNEETNAAHSSNTSALNEKFQQQIERQNKTIISLQQTNTSLAKQLNAEKQKNEETNVVHSSNTSTLNEKFQQQIERQNKTIMNLQQTNASLNEQMKENRMKHEKLLCTCAELEKQLKSAKKSEKKSKEAKYTSLCNQLHSFKEENNKYKEINSALRDKLGAQKKDYTLLQKSYEDLKNVSSNTRSSDGDSEAFKFLQKKYKRKKLDLIRALNEIDQLKGTMGLLESEVKNLKKSKDKELVKTMAAQLGSALQENRNLEEKINDLKSRKGESERKCNDLKLSVAMSEEKLRKAEEKVRELQLRLDERAQRDKQRAADQKCSRLVEENRNLQRNRNKIVSIPVMQQRHKPSLTFSPQMNANTRPQNEINPHRDPRLQGLSRPRYPPGIPPYKPRQ